MPKNKNDYFVFVKGNQGKFAYEITDHTFKPLHEEIQYNLSDINGKPLFALYTDLLAINDSLKYIKSNPRKFSKNPNIFIFTTYENNFHVFMGLKKPKVQEMKNQFNLFQQQKKNLIRLDIGKNEADDNVKIYWIPKGFENRMTYVENIIKSKFSPK